MSKAKNFSEAKVTKKRVQNKKISFFFYTECIVNSRIHSQSYEKSSTKQKKQQKTFIDSTDDPITAMW